MSLPRLNSTVCLHRNRYYSPQTGRFISEDPIGWASGQTNAYAYVNGNPVSLYDPFGFWSVSGSVYGGFGVQVTVYGDGSAPTALPQRLRALLGWGYAAGAAQV
ncbi:RHS repeat-associated core domain-containing protein [Paraburkholderia nemoris]|uniref:RHS repeat-associated core domain-containing protein n=1 Tax=Paraburkholderia nemoris TaxID=2793076 RepID=UPI0038BD8C82